MEFDHISTEILIMKVLKLRYIITLNEFEGLAASAVLDLGLVNYLKCAGRI